MFLPKTFGSWGGWVSEKMQLLRHICLWLYGPLLLIDDAVEYKDPEKPVKEWYISECRKWLEARGLMKWSIKS
jgi:hypothetical protein